MSKSSRAFGAVQKVNDPFVYESNPNKPDNWGALGFQTFPWLQQQLDFASGLEPQRQSAINQLLQSLSPANTQALVNQYRQQQFGQAGDLAHKIGLQLAAQGENPDGAKLAALNNAADASNQYSASVNSPQGKAQALQAILQAIGAGQQMPALSPASQLFENSLQSQAFRRQGEQYQTQLDHQGGLGGLLGSIFGDALGGLDWGSILGGL